MIENLVVIGNGKVYYCGVNPLVFNLSLVGDVVYVDPAIFETASILVDAFCKDYDNPASPKVDNKIRVIKCVRQLFKPLHCGLKEAKDSVDMVFALWAARGSLWNAEQDQATIVR